MVGYNDWFIKGDPNFHFVTKTVKHEVSIVLEKLNKAVIQKASIILYSLRQVPVVQSNLKRKGKEK